MPQKLTVNHLEMNMEMKTKYGMTRRTGKDGTTRRTGKDGMTGKDTQNGNIGKNGKQKVNNEMIQIIQLKEKMNSSSQHTDGTDEMKMSGKTTGSHAKITKMAGGKLQNKMTGRANGAGQAGKENGLRKACLRRRIRRSRVFWYFHLLANSPR